MGNYSKDRLSLIAQDLAGGGKLWTYSDTGSSGNIIESAGFITDGADMGMDTGDYVLVHATDGNTNKTTLGSSVVSVTDTGGSATLGLSVLIGDTS